MPEGHLVHRDAVAQHTDLAGRTVTVSSPQGRLDTAPVDGRVLDRVEAYGKHLFQFFLDAPTVHVHLGMQGLWLRHPEPATPPRKQVRLRLADTVAYDLIAPSACELLPPDDVAALLAQLGPDPLRQDADPEEAVHRLRAARGSVGAVILDQGVWSGIGNAWRAELLWLCRLHPRRAAAGLDPQEAHALWRAAATYLRLGQDAGQVISDPDAPAERWVYRREHCRSCGTAVATAQIGGRTAYWCPTEQSL